MKRFGEEGGNYMGRKQTRGACAFCGEDYTGGGMTRHLSACPKRREAIEEAEAKPGEGEPLYHLGLRDAWGTAFWLHLEMRGSATLAHLDQYLRAIWLECCGHLSEFFLGRAWGEELPMGLPAERLFQKGLQLTHIYDFGTSSETLIEAVKMRVGKPLTSHPILLMARNNPPKAECTECGEPASWMCLECIYDLREPGTLCDKHAETHPHEDYGAPVPLVNSPRVGMCAYCGPAEPPY